MKTLYYEYENKYVKFTSNYFNDENDYNVKKITQAIKLSLRRKFNISIQEYCVSQHVLIEKCGFCDNYSYIELEYDFKKFKKSHLINIKNTHYPSNFYCKEKGCEGKTLNPNSIDFVKKSRKTNKKEAIKIIHERNNSPFYVENHNNKTDYKNYQSLNNRLSKEKYKKFIKNLKFSKTIDYYTQKYGENEGTKIWNEINEKKDSMSFSYFLKKNNFNYRKSIIEYKNRVKSVLPKNKSYIGGNYSQQSYKIFIKLVDKLSLTNCMFGEHEFFIEYIDKENKKRKFFYDFTDLNNKIIIEFNGLRWHPNKNKMTTEQYTKWYHPFDNDISKTYLEEKDKMKNELAIKNGFKFITLWDSETDDENFNVVKKFYGNI